MTSVTDDKRRPGAPTDQGDDLGKHDGGAVDQRAAAYRPGEDLDNTCAMCVHYSPSSSGLGAGSCALVAGTIRPDYTCDMFLGITTAEAVSLRFEVSKVDQDQRLVFGFAKLAVEAGETEPMTDRQGDVVEPEELEKAAYRYVLTSRDGGEMHKRTGVATLVESMMFTDEKLAKICTAEDGTVDTAALEVTKRVVPQGWWVGFKVTDDEVWKAVKDGSYPMFSIHGRGTRTPMAD